MSICYIFGNSMVDKNTDTSLVWLCERAPETVKVWNLVFKEVPFFRGEMCF